VLVDRRLPGDEEEISDPYRLRDPVRLVGIGISADTLDFHVRAINSRSAP
jgi:hypothetical protein